MVEDGMAYNSYVILDEKIAVMDSVESRFGDEWISNIRSVIGDRKPDYLVISHMEPDHSSNIERFAKEFPEASIVGNAKTFAFMDQFYSIDSNINRVIVICIAPESRRKTYNY